MNNLVIIGTSHIAKQSIDEIKKTIAEIKPDIIALELDRQRFYALTHKAKRGIPNITRIGFKGFLFSLLGQWVQKKLGKKVGVKPGAEMLTAIKLAKKNKMKIALVDQDIEITLQRFSKNITWKDKFSIVKDLVKGVIFKQDELLQLGIKDFDLSKVPEKKIVKKLIGELKKRYPSIHKVLVEERNEYMAKKIVQIMINNPEKKIVAIVGAGHQDELLKLIKKSLQPSLSYSFTIEQDL